MKTFTKILLILSLALNIYLAYTLVMKSTDIDFLEMELENLDQQAKVSLDIFRVALLGKTKEEVMQLSPNIGKTNFHTINNIEVLRIKTFKFEFIDNKLKSITIDPR